MLLANGWRADSRVIREAGALANAGYDVHVVVQDSGNKSQTLTEGGVTYHEMRARGSLRRVFDLPRLLLLHLHVALLGARDLAGQGQWWRATTVLVSSSLLLVAQIAFAPIMAALVLVRKMLPQGGRISEVQRKGLGTLIAVLRLDSIIHLNHFAGAGLVLALSLKPDIVHAHDLVTLSTGFAVSRYARIPLIYDAHELETHTNYWEMSNTMRDWIAYFEAHLARRCTAVITVCESIADWLKEHYAISRPIVVHNTPDLISVTATQGQSLRSHLHLPESVPLAVYVGSVTVDRGLAQCVRAAARLPDLHLAFVGPRYEGTEAELRALVRALALESRVHFVDPVPSAMVSSFISDADCSLILIQNVCLSYYFTFPNKLLESVFAGVPVIGARLVELERFIERFGVGVVTDETDPAAIASAIKDILGNKVRYTPSKETLEKIDSEYGWVNQRRKLLALYGSLLAATPAPQASMLEGARG